ncbi:hypothetical protein GO001_21820 [Streptomyces sp. NRRL B-1677]|uniref:hypothetical protein n=1 Tax=Streptomyces sp. NRRL B-1677 TaxID=2682966 RepID=UPI001892AEDB|nr:hypothetical protein [Streptomyces sp. NRRL B-1677]MBF6047836.1 hypothetical protein [Streptomyces sp. NRRL B-1677]
MTGNKGRIVTLASPPPAKRHGITMMSGTRAAATVAQVAALTARGALRLPIARRFLLRDTLGQTDRVTVGAPANSFPCSASTGT